MSVVSEIGKVASGSLATGGLYIGILGLLLSDLIPTPADAVYFSLQRKLRLQLEKKEITPAQYWERDALYYYTLNVIWWAFVFLITAMIKGSAKHKLIVFLGLLGTGAVVGVIAKNIKKDEELMQMNKS